MDAETDFSDEALAASAQRGDLAAFDELVRRHHGRIWRYLQLLCRDPHTAADLTQETFVTAFLQLHRFYPTRAWLPWLFTIARNKWVDHQRRRGVELVSLQESWPAPGRNPGERAGAQDTWDHLWAWARQHLPSLQCQALWLRYHEELRVDQIAEALGISLTYVKVLLFRARRRLAREWWPVQQAGSSQLGIQSCSAARGVPPERLSLAATSCKPRLGT
ncbi:MAG: RNA polymerase sigma factor [Verrucomicrobiota bacterium]|nr:RNA polymerase sigma factor [Limisphaera sp.]MDW8381791.1 RNA polymerase sigma factor [Verrucomicrobiota bacterium]